MKKHIALFLSLSLIAMLLPAAALGEAGGEADIEALLSAMTLEQKVGQMMIVAFRIWKEVPETDDGQEVPGINMTELNDQARACLRDYHFGGTILYAQNINDAGQVMRLVSDIQTQNLAGGGLPMLVATDQEGGIVSRLSFGTAGLGNMALAATGDPANARTMAAIYGAEMGLLGINTNFAPVADVNDNPNNPIIGIRAFSDDPETVSEFTVAYMQGLHDQNTIATVKHFPGHGNTDTDSHTGLPCVARDYDALKAVELAPFQAAIDAGVDMVMTAHIQYPLIETGTHISASTGKEINLPATMSHRILTDILRGDMGFEGVVVSDALDMLSIQDNFTDEDVLRLTINAGVDMLLLPNIIDTVQFQRNMDMVDTAIRLVKEGEIAESRVDEAVRRILTLKQKYGLLDQADFAVTDARIEAALNGIGSAEHRQVAWDIAEKANTLLKNDGAFPIDLRPGETTLILFADSCASRTATGTLVKEMLGDEGAGITVMKNTADNGEECLQVADAADHVVLVHRVYNSDCLDPATGDGFSSAVFDQIIEARHADGRDVIVVSCQLPYDATRFPDANAIVLAYGSSPMHVVPPETGPDSAYAPNLPAALCACFGKARADGKTPVRLPELDENYNTVTGTN